MKTLDKLIAELCPDGVSYRPLGEIGELIRGNGIQKSDFVESGVGCIHYGQIHTHYGTWATETKSFISPTLAAKTRHARTGDLIIATTSEDDAAVGKSVAWLGSDDVAVSTDAFILRHQLDPKYISYFFQTNQFQVQKLPHVNGAKVRRISGNAIAKIMVPVPPLEIQREIARILDKFSALEESLKAELKAELDARKKQCEYYRDSLLTFHSSGEGVRRVTLNEVSEYSTGRIASEFVNDENFIGVDNLLSDKRGKTTASYRPNTSVITSYGIGDVLLGNIRPYLKKIWIADRIGGCSGDVLAIKILDSANTNLSPRFLFHVLSSDSFFAYNSQNAKGAKMPRGDKSAILRYGFFLPPLDEQERIVKILDDLDIQLNDLSVGLPDEIAARHQQYEYYREKLLTFKELKS